MNTSRFKVLKHKCENSLMFYTRYIFKENYNKKFRTANHLDLISETLEKVTKREITRLIINVPPRYGKTEIAVKCWVSWCLANNPKAKFIHLSYSKSLALDNSSAIKDYVTSSAYTDLWDVPIRNDSKSKEKWYTKEKGGVYATSTGGAITGFGAGSPDEGEEPTFKNFGGAIIIDDPLKPDDAFSEPKRTAVNMRFNNTIKSRVNDRNTPIIVIMQRLHENDLSGFLLDGGSGEEWTHLNLPAIDSDNNPLWEDKHNIEELEQMRQADRYTFAGQYMQSPAPIEGGVWQEDWFNTIDISQVPRGLKYELFIDGAYTKDNKNDPTGYLLCATKNNNLYIYHAEDKRLELPELVDDVLTYINKKPVPIKMCLIEPKASGKSLNQFLKKNGLRSREITSKDSDFVSVSKLERAVSSSPYIEGGRVYLINGGWIDAYLSQVCTFPAVKHDEYVDLTCYAIERYLIKKRGRKIDVEDAGFEE